MEDGNWNLTADREQRRAERKRIQNRVAQRTYRNRMKQRVEDLERQVTTLRRQAQARGQPTFEEVGEGQDEVDGNVVLSSASVTAEVDEVVPGDQAVADGKTGWPNNRKRTRRAAPDSHNDEPSGMSSSDSHGMPETRNENSVAEGDLAASSLLSSRPFSQLRSRTQAGASHTQAQSPTPPHQTLSQDRDTGAAHAEPQSLASLLSEEPPQEPGQPLLSPSNSTGAYFNPSPLSQAGHGSAAAPFAPPYFSSSMPTLGTFPPPFPGYPLVPMNPQGQYTAASQDWSWPHPPSDNDNRGGTYGQQVLLPDKYGPGSAPEPNPPQPAVADAYDAAKVPPSHVSHPRVSPTDTARMTQSGRAEICRQLSLDEDRDIEPDHETASTSADKTPDPSPTPDASSPCPSDFVDTLLCGLPLRNAEQMREFSIILQEVLDGIRSDDDGTSNSNHNNNGRSQGARKVDSPGKPQVHRQSLEDRFEFIRLCLAAVGFPSIDVMVGQYYTADFRHDSPVARQQRISRHTQLPLLVARLRKSTQMWTQWEAHGYQSEIIRSAVSLIHNERRGLIASRDLFADARAELETVLSGGAAANAGGSASRRPPSSTGAFRLLIKMLQDTMPKLWLLTEELENLDDSAGQRQRLYTSLAIVLLLCCAGRLPSSEMNALAIGCLSIADTNKT